MMKSSKLLKIYSIILSAFLFAILLGVLSTIFNNSYKTTIDNDDKLEFERLLDGYFEMSDAADAVPDARTAVHVADAYLKSKFGHKVYFNYPYEVYFDEKNDIWCVRGKGFSLLTVLSGIEAPTIFIHKNNGAIKMIYSMRD